MLKDDKYLVLRRDRMEDEAIEKRATLAGLVVPDAVVVRCQDLFAAPALSTYADTILTTLEIADLVQPEARVKEALLRTEAFFRDRAEEARGWPGKKLPD